jgi:acyl transferase domain-containing protein
MPEVGTVCVINFSWQAINANEHRAIVLTQDLKAFDAPFFGFTQQEAISLDPQQRLLLECTFEALESAGVPKHNAVGRDVGVFIGGSFSEYEVDLFRDPETIPMHQATGMQVPVVKPTSFRGKKVDRY